MSINLETGEPDKPDDDYIPVDSPKRWHKLTDEQLRGADFALRVVYSSTVIRGEALAIMKGLMKGARAEMDTRRAAK